MVTTTDRFKHESMEDADTIAKYLNALKDGFQKGALLFATEEKQLLARPRGLITMEVEARHRDDEVKLTLKFRWSETSESPDDRTSPLTIKPLSEEK